MGTPSQGNKDPIFQEELEKATREPEGPKRGELYGMDTSARWPVPAKSSSKDELDKKFGAKGTYSRK